MVKMQKIILINGSHPDYLLKLRGDLIRKLIAMGYSVHVSTPNIDDSVRESIATLGAVAHEVSVSRRKLNPFSDLNYLLEMWQLIRRLKPYFVINYTIKPNIWASFAARLAKARYGFMVTGLGYAFIPSDDRLRSALQKAVHKLYRFASAGAYAVLFQNPDDVEDFRQAGCLQDRSKAKITNGSGVDIDHFYDCALPQDDSYLLISRLLITKGVREYVEAGLKLKAEAPDVKIRLAGFLDSGPDAISEAELDSWIARGVEYLGKLDDIRPAMEATAVYVLPSYREGTPRTVLEAMSMGRPIISTDAPGCRETVVHQQNGILIPVADEEALYLSMKQLRGNPELKEVYGRRSRSIALEKYAVERVNQATTEYFGL